MGFVDFAGSLLGGRGHRASAVGSPHWNAKKPAQKAGLCSWRRSCSGSWRRFGPFAGAAVDADFAGYVEVTPPRQLRPTPPRR
jgi:hypothetical protein